MKHVFIMMSKCSFNVKGTYVGKKSGVFIKDYLLTNKNYNKEQKFYKTSLDGKTTKSRMIV